MVDEDVVTRGLQKPDPVFPLGTMVVFAKSMLAATLQNITTLNNEK